MSPEAASWIAQQTDVVTLRQLVLAQAEQIERLEEENEALRQELESLKAKLGELDPATQAAERQLLQERIDLLRQKLYGRSSERRRTGQGGPRQDQGQQKPPQTGHGPRPQPQLEVEIRYHEASEAERLCRCCGRVMVPLGEQYEESEEITVIPRRYVLIKHRRRKYRCPGHDGVLTAPGPDKLMPGGRYSPSFAVEVAVDKYGLHLPLERQSRAMKTAGLTVTTQTLSDQLAVLARLVAPTVSAIGQQILREPVVQADETRWPILANGKVKANQTAYAWCLLGRELVVYYILGSRGQDAGRQVLQQYGGVVMADGYEVYEALARGQPAAFTVAHCWAHVRRKFVEIQDHAPAACEEVLTMIRALFDLERQFKPLTAEERLRRRQAEAKPLVDDIFQWAAQQQAQVLPRSSLAGALGYLLNLEVGLRKFLDDPAIPLDNNAAERAQRGLVLGRVNHYGSRSAQATQVAATFYTLIESAKLTGVDPRAYLRALTQAALKDPTVVLLPADFKQQLETV